YVARFDAAMADDFNAPEALAVLYEIVRDMNNAGAAGDTERQQELAALLKSLAAVLGILRTGAEEFLQTATEGAISAEEIDALIADRAQAKKDRDFARADQIRAELTDRGVVLEDSREGTTWRRA
ncbi:MAG: DALR domain-containing protein, partial [Spongiibacter sp.]